MLNFAFYCGFIWSIQKKAVLLRRVRSDRYVRRVVDDLCGLGFDPTPIEVAPKYLLSL
jgi:hypothetical protein